MPFAFMECNRNIFAFIQFNKFHKIDIKAYLFRLPENKSTNWRTYNS